MLEKLAPWSPRHVSTVAAGLDLEDSDLDVVCHAPELPRFARALERLFGDRPAFTVREAAEGHVVARFESEGFVVEVYGAPLPVSEQLAARHFAVMQRLVTLGGGPFQSAIRARKRAGLATEPAIAATLGLPGDPYEAVLALEDRRDAELERMLARAREQGFLEG